MGEEGEASIDNIERDKPMGSSTLLEQLESELEEKGRRGKEGEREG